jgi:hypothetical protein
MSLCINLAGTSFCNVGFTINAGDKITVCWEKDNQHTKGDEAAYAVMLDGAKIGYIPSIITIKEKLLKARKDGNQSEFNYLWEMCNSLVYLRDCIYTDFTRNHLTPMGEVFKVKYQDDDGSWTETERGGNVHIVVCFDYD